MIFTSFTQENVKKVPKRLLTLALLCFSWFHAGAAISITGVYQGKNLTISNPLSEDGFGYSVTRIVVNGDVLPIRFNGSTAEIDLSSLSILPGTIVTIQISCEGNQCPVILTPEALLHMKIDRSRNAAESLPENAKLDPCIFQEAAPEK